MQLIYGREIKRALREIQPTSIAVAYVGIDWADYVDVSALKEIVLSPTLGSNPFAIAKIASELGWDKVYFLDNLHAKIYLGVTGAAVGSFNLTANGLSAEGLEEAGYVVRDRMAIEQLRVLLAQYRSQAQAAYPTTALKLERMAELRTLWDCAATNKIIRDDAHEIEIASHHPIAADEDSLRKAFAARVRASMDIAVGHGYVTGLIERMLASQHAVEVAKKLVHSSEIKRGLKKLVKAGKEELSFESMMLEVQFEKLFSKEDRECADFNLREAKLSLGFKVD
ncbi:Uncharacterised protein [Burkholderia pseudomallei]|nr:Uncharacterised protein [Burkholderia pseudomallei]